MPKTARQIIHDVHVANDLEGLERSLDHDQVTAILTLRNSYFALGDNGDRYSWVTGHMVEDSCSGTELREPDSSGSAETEAEARAAAAEWIAQVPSEE